MAYSRKHNGKKLKATTIVLNLLKEATNFLFAFLMGILELVDTIFK